MLRYLIRQVIIAVLALIGISVLLFIALRLLPGDPAEMRLDPFEPQGNRAETLARLRNEMGLDEPLPIQYMRWVGSVLRGDLGYSFADRRPVTDVIGARIGASSLLMVASMLVALVVGAVLGVVAAVNRNGVLDYISTGFSMVTISVPSFFSGIVAIYWFAVRLGWFPTGGMRTSGREDSLLDLLHHLALPSLVLGLVIAGPYARYIRASMVEVLAEPYMTTARSKGLSRSRILIRHGLRNGLIPVISVAAVQIPQLIAGVVVIEQVFTWPGLGRLALNAIGNRDYPLVIAFVMFIAVLVVVANLIADVLYSAVDPRIRSGART